MKGYEFLNDRTDSARWSHPEVTDIYDMVADNATALDTFYNFEIPFDERQAMAKAAYEQMKVYITPTDPDHREEHFEAPGCVEDPDAPLVPVFVTWPKEPKPRNGKLPVILICEGGGLTSCLPSTPRGAYADEIGAVCISFIYRCNFDFPGNGGGYPGTINDVHAVYQWMVDHADELGFDLDRVVLTGNSSGGQLALSACHRLKRYDWCGAPKPRGVIVATPIVDERQIYPSNQITLRGGWDGRSTKFSCKQWLGVKHNELNTPAEALANHATAEECLGLPPTFIHTEESDASTDPVAEYVSKLQQAGVYTEYHVWGGATHGAVSFGFMSGSDAPYVKRFGTVFYGNIRDMLQYDLRRAWIDEELARR